MSSFTTPIASFASANFTPDRLVISTDDVLTKKITLLSGQNCVRGTVLGKVAVGAASSAAKSGGNTGGGTLTLDGTTPILAGAQVGVYTVRCIAIASNSGTFTVIGPNGESLGQVVVGATFADQIKFVLADVGTDFAVGDGFDITVAAGSGKYVKAVAAAVDGSQTPDVILVEDTDATSADQEALAYYAGVFNSSALTLGAGLTVAGIFEGLRQKGIMLPPAPQAA